MTMLCPTVVYTEGEHCYLLQVHPLLCRPGLFNGLTVLLAAL